MAFCLLFSSCNGNRGNKAGENAETRKFQAVSVPAMYTDPQAAANYAADHFWDAFADTSKVWLEDSTHIAGIDAGTVEQQVGTYVSILNQLPLSDAQKAIESFYDHVAEFGKGETFDKTVKMVSKYLYDPNSPVRNEDIYGTLAGKLSQSPCVQDSLKASYEYEEKTCRLNRIGTPAADFSFTDKNGRTRTLYSVKAPYTLLFFSNPGCHACGDIISLIKENVKLEKMVENGTLAIVNVYIDEDLDSWKQHLGDYPSTWLTGYDKPMAIRTDVLYNVRAIPSLYVLDKDKTVIMKDAPQEKVISYLSAIEL